jgi:AcrR family transcriptional regulator
VKEAVNRRRQYRSPLRAEQAQETRRRVLAAADELFVSRGYAGTTIAAVAEAAGVSTDTVRISAGGKRGLLEGVLQHRRADPDDLDQQRRRAEIATLADPHERLRRLVALSCETLARTSPVHAVIRGAADEHPFAVDLREQMLRRRLEVQGRNLRTFLGTELRDGLSEDEALRRYSALLSPELFHLVTVECGWSSEHFQAWVAELLARDLLVPGAAAGRQPTTSKPA